MSKNNINHSSAWIQTYSGKKLYYFNPTEYMIDENDIFLALPKICRFNGQSHFFYSVAEHSIQCTKLVKPENRLYALLHDSPEIYCADLCTPIKIFLPQYQKIENKILKVIAKKYNFDIGKLAHDDINRADKIMLATEARDLFPHLKLNWSNSKIYKPLKQKIKPREINDVREEFKQLFYELTNGTY